MYTIYMEGRRFFNEMNKPNTTEGQLHCCTLNCGTDLCPKHRLVQEFQASHSFNETVNVFQKIQGDELMRDTEKPLLYKKVIYKMIQQANTKEECDRILNLLTTIPHASKDNFAEAHALISDKVHSIENQ